MFKELIASLILISAALSQANNDSTNYNQISDSATSIKTNQRLIESHNDNKSELKEEIKT